MTANTHRAHRQGTASDRDNSSKREVSSAGQRERLKFEEQEAAGRPGAGTLKNNKMEENESQVAG